MNKVLAQWIEQSDNIVFFGGAGVSTESGIPDFRSERGLYKEVPEKMISHTYYVNHTADFYRFYKDKMLFPDVKPNRAHYKLAELEKSGKLKAVITQNIDGLHQAAGSVNVLELHGSVHRNFCLKCKKMYPLEYILNDRNPIPLCSCGGQLKPDVVLYEESLDMDILRAAVRYISAADMLIVGGTSLVVNPAASLITYYNGSKLVLINLSETPYDSHADLIIREKIGTALG